MSRVVKKKVIDENLVFSDNFDESMLDRIESELGKSLTDEEKAARKRSGKMARPTEEDHEAAAKGPSPLAAGGKEPEETAAQAGQPSQPGGGPQVGEEKTLPAYRRIAAKRWISAACILVFFVVLPAIAWLRIQSKHMDAPVIQFVRHPVPLPHLQRESKFLLVADTGAKKDLVEMSVQFEFLSTSALEKFENQQTAIQDSCYRFIQTRNPAENSPKIWAKLVQHDMMDHLRTSFPKIRIDSITMTQYDRL